MLRKLMVHLTFTGHIHYRKYKQFILTSTRKLHTHTQNKKYSQQQFKYNPTQQTLNTLKEHYIGFSSI